MSTGRPIAPRRPRPIIEEPTYRPPNYQSRVWGRVVFIGFLLAFCAVLGTLAGLYWTIHKSQGTSGQPITFAINRGDSVSKIATRLQQRGLIDNTLAFRIDARLQGLGNTLKIGGYTLRRNMSIDDMVATLGVYKPGPTVTITIPEGYRLEQTAATLQAHGIDARSFLAEARHPDPKSLPFSILRDKPPGAGLEGYLFPNTYDVPVHSSGRAFAIDMVSQLGLQFTPAMRAAARQQHWTVYQILTLASIVEREAHVPDERALIASVYINRLRNDPHRYTDGKLQADPTVQYALASQQVPSGTGLQKWWPVLHDQAVNIVPGSPYNTYTHTGLPPGPIASAGLDSIKAAIYPARTQHLFFVAKGNGRHAFADTLQEQNQNIATYQH